MALGIHRITGLNPRSDLIPAVAMAIGSSVFEELRPGRGDGTAQLAFVEGLGPRASAPAVISGTSST